MVFFDEGRGVAKFELVEVGTVDGRELGEAAVCIAETGGEDR